MLGLIPVADILTMLTVDDDETTDCLHVADILTHKRQSGHYPDLLEEIRDHGIDLPILIRTFQGRPWLADGHHRVAAPIDLGMTHLVWSDLPLDAEDRPLNPMMRTDWGPYRPTT